MSAPIKLSSPATREFWEIPVLFEDADLLALDKPPGLLTSPDRHNPELPSLIRLLHAGIEAGKPWATGRALAYLSNAHRLDAETGGVLLLARSKPVLARLVETFGSEKPVLRCTALVHGHPPEARFEVDVKLAPHPVTAGLMLVDPRRGKRSRTTFEIVERFADHTLLDCTPLTGRAHQVRAHLRHAGFPVVGDALYGGKPLWLSRLKKGFRLKEGREERPLISRPALHAAQLTLLHPVTGAPLTIASPWPKDFKVAVKYLRQFAPSLPPAP